MLRTKLALKVLTKAEQKHLTIDANVHSMASFLSTREYQLKHVKDGGYEPCYECKHIAFKLGVN